jgi:hypothetical protein
MKQRTAGLISSLVVLGGFGSRVYADANDATAASAAGAVDGFRLRHGIAFSLGQEYGSGPSSGLSGTLGGVDWRLGGQIDNRLAVYLDTHLSFGNAHIGASSGITGDFALAAMGEYTLANQYAFAAGFGYGVLNNPSGPLGQIRAAWYPFATTAVDSPRRKGLMVGFDARFYFADGMTIGTVTQLSLSVGYEKY